MSICPLIIALIVLAAGFSRLAAAEAPTPPVDPETAKFVSLLAHEDPATRAEAAAVLGTLCDPDSISALSKTTYDGDLRVRWAAAEALSSFAADAALVPFSHPSARKKQDGRKVAFDSGRTGAAESDRSSPAAGELFVINADGSDLRRITTNGPTILDISPTLSRDGKRVAYMSGNFPNWDTWVANTDGTGRRSITDHEACDSDPAISPDGSRIAFVSDRNGNRQISHGEARLESGDGRIDCRVGVLPSAWPSERNHLCPQHEFAPDRHPLRAASRQRRNSSMNRVIEAGAEPSDRTPRAAATIPPTGDEHFGTEKCS
ncbi:MAG: HEAT repeat domain-containing protein [Planctomycetales bacterium]